MILAHDLGTTGDKAALYGTDGGLVAAVTARYATDYGPGGRPIASGAFRRPRITLSI